MSLSDAPASGMAKGMRSALPLLLAAFLVPASAGTAAAACYADYKAKQDDPLRLHYGVIEIDDAACDPQAAADVIDRRLQDGWQMLQVIGVFGPEGLDERRARAGDYYLRY